MNNDALTTTEITRIRHRIMSLIYHNGSTAARVPSIREMAKQESVANSTVQLAYDRMITEGYLIPKHGIGTFTNPLSGFGKAEPQLPLIGLKINHGDQFFYDELLQRDIILYMTEFLKYKCNIRFLTYGCYSAEEFRKEIVNSGVNALVCANVKTDFVKTAAMLVPTVHIDRPVDGVSSFYSDTAQCVMEMAATAKKLGAPHRILCMDRVDYLPLLETELHRQFSGCLEAVTPPMSNEEMTEILKEELTPERMPGIILTHSSRIPPILNYLKEQDKNCIVIAIDSEPRQLLENTYYSSNNYQQIIPAAIKAVFEMLDHPNREVEHRAFPQPLKAAPRISNITHDKGE